MKKFWLPLMLAFAILIPSAQAQAADVPGFYQFGGKYLTFVGGQDLRADGYRTYVYNFDIDLNEDFAEQYVRILTNNYGFRLIDHTVHEYTLGQSKRIENWFLVYTGSKRVSKFESLNIDDLNNPYYCHLSIGKYKDWEAERAYFSIAVAYGLIYGED